MLKLRISANTESPRSNANGATYPPVDTIRLLLAVAINDAGIR